MKRTSKNSPVTILGVLFFVFGFITWLNSVLIPYLKIACELSNLESYFVAFSFYISYLVMALPSGWILQYTGYKKGMAAGLLVMAIGTLIFLPAASSRAFPLFLLGLFIQGSGLALLQTASNPYITILGPSATAARRISIMGICNKVAGVLAPIVLGAVTLRGVDELRVRIGSMDVTAKVQELDGLARRVILPYVIISVALIGLAAYIYLSSLPEIGSTRTSSGTSAGGPPGDSPDGSRGARRNAGGTQRGGSGIQQNASIWQFPHLLLGVLALFCYMGAEVIAGDTIINYGLAQHIPLATAKFFSSLTLGCMILGYIIGVVGIPRYFTHKTALKASAVVGFLFVVACIMTNGIYSVFFIGLLGLANALMWPAIWPMALNGLGRLTNLGSALLIMGISGGAIFPLVYGRIAEFSGAKDAYWIVAAIYLYLLYYATYGHKVRPRSAGVVNVNSWN